MSERRDASASVEAVLFDMDGVVTDTAEAHAAAWKRLFDDYLQQRAAASGDAFRPFDDNEDYRKYVDGKPRYDGVKSFLESRGIDLPWGDDRDGADAETICGLGDRKNNYFNDWLDRHQVKAFPGTLAFIRALAQAGIRTAVFSSSRNAAAVLDNAGVLDLFDVKVDGADMQRLGLPGKPDPAILHQCAERLDVQPEQCAVVEDAIAGIEAGLRGGYAPVIGIDRSAEKSHLGGKGAHFVVGDAAELKLEDPRRIGVKRLHTLATADDCKKAIRSRIGEKRLIAFLDYDGTLTPIVDDPANAKLHAGMRDALAALADATPVVMVSGRDLQHLRRLVQLDNVFLVGSHGFELAEPGGTEATSEKGTEFLPDLDQAEKALRGPLEKMPGTILERKKFAIAVHYRQVDDAGVERVKNLVREIVEREPRLGLGFGKKVLRVQPAIGWNKGRAVDMLLEKLDIGEKRSLPLYIGDDITDEDAFRALSGRGIGIAVQNGERQTAADYALADCPDVERFIRWLTDLTTGPI